MSSRGVTDRPKERGDSPAAGPRRALRGHPWLTLFAVAIGVMMVDRKSVV